jgi:hypothetical protein
MRDGMDEFEAIADSTKSNNPNAARIRARMQARLESILRGPELHDARDL